MADNIIIEGGFFSDKQIIAEDFATAFSGLVSNGVLETIDNNALKVTSGTGMNLNVSRGYFWVDGQFGKNGTSTVVTIDIGDSEYSRYDRIVARVNKTTKTAEIGVLKGTANANPVAPDITRDGTIFELSLATIDVPATATELTTANIQDNRADTDLCGFCTPKFDEIDTSAVFDGFYAEWEHFKGQLAEDPAGNLQFQIGNLNNLETEKKENLVEAINNSMNIINGIPVNLTGIYNGQMIGYDEESGTLLPMTSYKRELDLEYEYVDVIESELYEYDPNGSPNFRTYFKKSDSTTDTTIIFQFQNAFMFSEFSNFYISFWNVGSSSNDPNFYADIMLSKDENFEVIDATWHIATPMNTYQNYSIVSLMGKYYIRIILYSRRQSVGIQNLTLS